MLNSINDIVLSFMSIISEGYLRTQSNIYDGAFYKNSKQLQTVNYFRKKARSIEF